MMEELIKLLFLLLALFLIVVLILPDFFPFTNLDEAAVTLLLAKILQDQFGMDIL
jgi:hypothetical protein